MGSGVNSASGTLGGNGLFNRASRLVTFGVPTGLTVPPVPILLVLTGTPFPDLSFRTGAPPPNLPNRKPG